MPFLVHPTQDPSLKESAMARILLINDEPDLLDVCKMALEIAGHTVATLTESREVLAVTRHLHPDLIGLDWVLSDSTGEEVLHDLKSTPDTRSTPVLVISALEGLGPEAKRLGAAGFLPKPFRAEELIRAVNELLAESQRAQHPAGA